MLPPTDKWGEVFYFGRFAKYQIFRASQIEVLTSPEAGNSVGSLLATNTLWPHYGRKQV
jgi:hypothetical protein